VSHAVFSATFLGAGAIAGILQAALLRRATRARGAVFGLPMRLLLIGGVLISASLAGNLVAAAAGWAGGFALGVFLQARSWS